MREDFDVAAFEIDVGRTFAWRFARLAHWLGLPKTSEALRRTAVLVALRWAEVRAEGDEIHNAWPRMR